MSPIQCALDSTPLVRISTIFHFCIDRESCWALLPVVTPAFTELADWGLVDLLKDLDYVGLSLDGIVEVVVEGVGLEMMVQGDL